MSTLTRTKAWQRARAVKLHEHFKAIAVQVEAGAKIGEELARAARMLNGRILNFPGGDRILKASPQTLRREWDKWNGGNPDPDTGIARCTPRTADALLLDYKPGCGGQRQIPTKLVAEIHRRLSAATGGRDKHRKSPISAVYERLCKDFEERKAIPGIDYADWPVGAEFPWSYETVRRHKPSRTIRLAGNVGIAAAKGASAYVSMNYSDLRKGELYTLDDARLDITCIDDHTGRAVEVVCYLLMEVGSRFIVAYILKPLHAIKSEDVDELLAHGLQTPGFGIGVDYPTHILFERGTVACSEAAQDVMQGATNEGILIHRTSMNGGVRWTGSPADKASGNSAGKGVIESFIRRFHYSLLHVPGQRGNLYGNQPANLGDAGKNPYYDKSGKLIRMRENNGTLIDESERLEQFNIAHGRRLRLKLAMLRFFELNAVVHDAIERHNHDAGHKYSGHGKFAEEEVEPGVWLPTDKAPDLHVAQLEDTRIPSRSADILSATTKQAPASNQKRAYVLADPEPGMSSKQRAAIYWQCWAQAEKSTPGLNRHALTHRILGANPRIAEMTPEQFEKLIRAFRAIATEKTS